MTDTSLTKFSRDGDRYADEGNGFWLWKEPTAPSHQWVLMVYAGKDRDAPCAYFPTMKAAREYAEAIVRTRYTIATLGNDDAGWPEALEQEAADTEACHPFSSPASE